MAVRDMGVSPNSLFKWRMSTVLSLIELLMPKDANGCGSE